MWSGISATASLLLDKSNSYTLAMHTNGIYVSSSFQLPRSSKDHAWPTSLAAYWKSLHSLQSCHDLTG